MRDISLSTKPRAKTTSRKESKKVILNKLFLFTSPLFSHSKRKHFIEPIYRLSAIIN